MSAFDLFCFIECITFSVEGDVVVNGFTLAEVRAVPAYVNWYRKADLVFESARQTMEAVGVLCTGMILWRASTLLAD